MAQDKSKWRLKKTLRRKIDVRPVEMDDLAYAWAAYKTGDWAVFEDGLDAEGFRNEFAQLVMTTYHAVWTVRAETKRGFVPICFAFGWWLHPNSENIMILDRFAWLPWVTPRQMIEALVAFVVHVRKEGLKMWSFSPKDERKIMEIVAKHGVIRRVGTSYELYSGEPATMWETR